ncbi:unnamed protein product [Lactuca saligna]|uniref:Uncharacterized protein n=1 Tax=Lactuca saligna TaxID=75948 RepID=A0AA35ZPN5_LACSI|nr:unnamed protein product [Lactuca saligna]
MIADGNKDLKWLNTTTNQETRFIDRYLVTHLHVKQEIMDSGEGDTKWWLHHQPKENPTSFWEPSWETMEMEEKYAKIKEFEAEKKSQDELSKAELLEALCHSQTRAREAEKAAQKANNEKEDMISQFMKQASQLFAYKQWFRILQLEATRNSKYHQQRVWKRKKKEKSGSGSSRYKNGKSFGSFVLGLSLGGAGFLLGWTLDLVWYIDVFVYNLEGFLMSVNRMLKLEIKMDSVAPAIEKDAQKTIPSPWEFSCDLEVDFKSDENAGIVYSTLAVDKELQPDKVKRLMSVSDGKLSVHFEAVEARFLRASYSAFLDALTLATKTIEQFGDVEHQNM